MALHGRRANALARIAEGDGEARTLKRFKVRASTYTYKRRTACAVRARRGAPLANQRAPSARIAAMRAHYYYYS